MDLVISADGTKIAYERAGDGPPIVFASGVFNDHHRLAPLAAALAGDFTTIGYDRRARGHSGDTRPYAIDREVEDLAALIESVGGAAAVFGYSSGAILALRAAATLPITRLALYEPPFVEAPRDLGLPARLDALVRQGRAGDVVELFQAEGIGLSAEAIAGARRSPMWPALEAMAQSVVYDATITAELGLPTTGLTAVPMPVLVLNGAETWPQLAGAARTLADAVPRARYQELPGGAHHDVPVEATADAVRKFLSSALDG